MKNANKRLVSISRVLRKNSTISEQHLWKSLRSNQLEGFKFRRQHPIGAYIVDFVCIENQVVVELDGGQHQKERENDEKRDGWLKSQGFQVLRFWNHEVLINLEGVLSQIRITCLDRHPHPLPLPQREREK